jgi:outer membrane lipoprotein-sorting protein
MAQGYIWASPVAKAILGGVLAVSGSVYAQQPVGAKAAAEGTGGALILNASSSTPQAVAKKAGVNMATSASPTAKVSVEQVTRPVEVVAAQKVVEGYFNNLKTMQANFTQHVTGEDVSSEGLFSYKWPRMFVFQYETPVKQKIVSTGTHVYYVDQSGGFDSQVTQLPMDAGVGRIFGSKSLNLKEAGLRVTEAAGNERLLRVLMVATKKIRANDQAGLKQAWLTFDKGTGGQLTLAGIEALDTLGVTTTVLFDHVRSGVPLSGKLFEYTPGVYRNRN